MENRLFKQVKKIVEFLLPGMNHLIFEGAELSGKSWLMSQIYDRLEAKYNLNEKILDGCHWFNCDVGVFGTERGRPVIGHYCRIFEELRDKNLLVEKFHLSDIVYNRLHRQVAADHGETEKILTNLGFKIILCVFPEDKKLLERRIADRLRLYPHYERILRDPEWYIASQREYLKELKKSNLPSLIIESETLPDERPVRQILSWIGE